VCTSVVLSCSTRPSTRHPDGSPRSPAVEVATSAQWPGAGTPHQLRGKAQPRSAKQLRPIYRSNLAEVHGLCGRPRNGSGSSFHT
jgi:hypothetical protein